MRRGSRSRSPLSSAWTDSEELFGTEGFSGNYSNIYYHFPPTRVKKIEKFGRVEPEEWHQDAHRHHHIKTATLPRGGDAVLGRQVLLYNKDVALAVAQPTEAMNYFYRNAPKDGTFIGAMQNNTPFEPLLGTKEAIYDATKFNWLGSPSVEVGLVVVWRTVPVNSIQELKGREIVVGASGANSTPS